MAESKKQRELRDKQRGLKALNSRDAASMELQRNQMAIWDDGNDDRRYKIAKDELTRLDALVTKRIAEIESINTVSIPFHEGLTNDDISYIISLINKWKKK